MGDLTSFLKNLFGGDNTPTTAGTVPTIPSVQEMQTGTGQALSGVPGTMTNALSGLQIGQLGLGAASGLLNGYLGFQNLGVAKKQAKQAQQNWDKQWSANVKNTNAALSDRQAARVASNPGAYESVDSYMKKYGIS
jgi:hypothetical protein